MHVTGYDQTRAFKIHQSSLAGHRSQVPVAEVLRSQQDRWHGTDEHPERQPRPVTRGRVIHVFPESEICDYVTIKRGYDPILRHGHFFNMVSAQPSTTMSWVADRKLATKNTHTIITMFGGPDSGSQTSMLYAMQIRHIPVYENQIVLKLYTENV